MLKVCHLHHEHIFLTPLLENSVTSLSQLRKPRSPFVTFSAISLVTSPGKTGLFKSCLYIQVSAAEVHNNNTEVAVQCNVVYGFHVLYKLLHPSCLVPY